ncbi:DUF2800 domain-containing protein [Clostridium sp. KNHs214]|uniref:DUF2800 domain-containing protein n=1 Tax=Clostridium sp. KNHs214 TaxID=1540257 RepID=UPI000557446C|nr:DUF2800 domain-containing protein [Clostridium sp. KNHs214]
MGKHALLSASSSHRWLHCPPSARLEEQFENTTSVFAAEGTAAHELSEHKLRTFLGIKSQRPISEFDSEELENYTDIYVDYATELITEVRSYCKDPIILIEQRLDYSCYVPEGFGTGDLVIIADSTLDIVDLKYGKGVAVSAEDNPQMKLYALGAFTLFDSLYDIQRVRMTICQPRLESVSTYEISADELTNWAEIELRPKAQLAINGEGEFLPGEHCRFCRARQTCRARAEEHLSLAKYDFKLPSLLSDEEIAEVLTVADRLSTWASDVYAYATDLSIREGKEWTGFKLVEGRSNRKYASEEAVIKVCNDNGITDIYTQSLLGITAMEKLLGKKKFKSILGDLVEKPQGKPTLVPSSDKRQSIKLNNTAEADFKEEI